MVITTRYARITDARNIAVIHVASWKMIYKNQLPASILENLSVDEREKLWASLLKQNVKIHLLEEQKNIIGFVSFGPSRDEDVDPAVVSEITAIYLHPDKWRKGLGKLLLCSAIEEIKKENYKSISLWVLDSNLQARHFYENLGFVSTNNVKIEQEDGYTWHEIRYWKTIA